MIDMIGQNPIFSTAIRLVVGQRLVRRLDDNTKVPYQPDEAIIKYIKGVLQDLPDHVPQPDYSNLTLYRPGKSEDSPFGYRGRTLIMEQLIVDDKIQSFIRGEVQDINTKLIEDTARQQGMVSLEQDGVLKAIAGITTLEEINRVL